MKLEFGYGNGVQTVEVRSKNLIAVLESNPIAHERRGEEAVRYALANPIGAPLLRQKVSPGQKIAIVTSDISRPLPSYDVLPAVLDELYAGGAKPEDITATEAGEIRRLITVLRGSAGSILPPESDQTQM